jgi:hypothetical protein
LKVKSKKEAYLLERIFKIKRIKNIIDLSNSFSVVNKKEFPTLFEAEIYKVTFSTKKQGSTKSHDLFMSYNALICDEEIENLKESLGVFITGDGSQFEILDYETDFTIQFDQENSSFIATDEVKNGLISFSK